MIRRKKQLLILKYAAAILFPVLLLTGGIYFFTNYQIEKLKHISQLNEVKPGGGRKLF